MELWFEVISLLPPLKKTWYKYCLSSIKIIVTSCYSGPCNRPPIPSSHFYTSFGRLVRNFSLISASRKNCGHRRLTDCTAGLPLNSTFSERKDRCCKIFSCRNSHLLTSEFLSFHRQQLHLSFPCISSQVFFHAATTRSNFVILIHSLISLTPLHYSYNFIQMLVNALLFLFAEIRLSLEIMVI